MVNGKQYSKNRVLILVYSYILLVIDVVVEPATLDTVDINCNRPLDGGFCTVGTCNQATLACDCGSRRGQHCQLTDTVCTKACSEIDTDATCYVNDANEDTCSCSPGYDGDFCQDLRVDVACTATSMYVRFYPYDNILLGFSKMYWDPSATGVEFELNALNADSVASSGGTTLIYGASNFYFVPDMPVASEESITTKFCIQFNKNVESVLDLCAEFTCNPVTDGGFVGFTSVYQSSDPEDISVVGVTGDEFALQVSFFTDPADSGTQIAEGGSVEFGAEVYLVLTMELINGLDEFFVDSLNTGPAADDTTIELITSGGCVDGDNKGILSSFKKKSTSSTNTMSIQLKFKVFRIRNQENLYFSGNAKFCKNSNGACVKPACAVSPFDQFDIESTRRKRDVVEDGDSTPSSQDIHLSLKVIDPNQRKTGTGASASVNADASTAVCLTKLSILVPFVAIAGLMILLLACVIFLLVKRKKQNPHTTKGHYPR